MRLVPMFWGVAFGWEVATGYPWGFWKGGDYDFIKEGKDRFVKKTAKIRKQAKSLGIYLGHEIHPGTAAMCADDFNLLVQICGGDKCLAVNADPSHCWEGEDWETRFLKVAPRIYACHVKNFVIRKGLPLRMMEPDWPGRALQFVDLPSGDLNLARYVEMLVDIGYPQRYCQVMNAKTAPLIVEAESAYRDLVTQSADSYTVEITVQQGTTPIAGAFVALIGTGSARAGFDGATASGVGATAFAASPRKFGAVSGSTGTPGSAASRPAPSR